jgi:LuxR family transcriptional regulator of csgAB operon
MEPSTQTNALAGSRSKIRVIILGPHALQNQLLGAFIQERTGLDTRSDKNLRWDRFHDGPKGARRLVLIDCLASPKTIPLPEEAPVLRMPGTLPALFNIDPGAMIEEHALRIGIRGVFYSRDDAEILIKGIKAILADELWFSRAVTSRLLRNTTRKATQPLPPHEDLTRRETEILIQLAAGGNNQQIAEALCISLHTVKTHLYNIYRKIGAENRLQASLWATHYLSQSPPPAFKPLQRIS